jgi:hypothetical protein
MVSRVLFAISSAQRSYIKGLRHVAAGVSNIGHDHSPLRRCFSIVPLLLLTANGCVCPPKVLSQPLPHYVPTNCSNKTDLCFEVGKDGVNSLLVFSSAQPNLYLYRLSHQVLREKTSYEFKSKPLFSNDGKSIYFLGSFSDTSYSLIRWSFELGVFHSITSVEDYGIVASGRYKDNITVQLRKSTMTRKWLWWWMFNPQLDLLDAIGDTEELEKLNLSIRK